MTPSSVLMLWYRIVSYRVVSCHVQVTVAIACIRHSPSLHFAVIQVRANDEGVDVKLEACTSELHDLTPFNVCRAFSREPPDNYLPVSHTCFFELELPRYSSVSVMRERLRYSIMNCAAIDTDNTPLGMNAAAMGWEE